MYKFFIILVLLASFSAIAEEKKEGEEVKKTTRLEFVDEGKNNPSFKAFREELLKRIEQKDAKYLISILSPDLKFTFGKRDDFIRFYRLDSEAEKSQVWIELKNVLRLGGVFTETEGFCASYVTCTWPDDASAPGMATIISKGAELRAAPSKDAKVIGTLSRNIVKTTFDSKALRAGWTSVQTLDGRRGYVRSNQVRLPTDYRAFFKERGGKWEITIYING